MNFCRSVITLILVGLFFFVLFGCVQTTVCGNGVCEQGETHENCSISNGGDCPPANLCGDGNCNALIGENISNCPADCLEQQCFSAGEKMSFILNNTCCDDLTAIQPPEVLQADGSCNLAGGVGVCSDCGNDICEDWENICNCANDCSNELGKRILVITNDYLVEELKNEFAQYADDLKSEFNYNTRVLSVKSTDLNWNFVDNLIKNNFDENLIGILFVGDIPSVLVNGNEPSDNYYFANYYSTCPYDSLTNSYTINEDCYFSSALFPKEKPFWMSRITPDWNYEEQYLSAIANCYGGATLDINSDSCKTRNEFMENAASVCDGYCSIENPDKCGLMNVYTYDECPAPERKIMSDGVAKIKNYFEKNHDYRKGNLQHNNKILIFATDSFQQYSKEQYLGELNFYSNIFDENGLVIADGSIENNSIEYLQDLESNYGFVFVNAHGLPIRHEHQITAQRIPQTNSIFMFLKSCSVGNYTEKNAIASTYLSKGALLVDASSVPLYTNSKFPHGMNYLLENGLTYADSTAIYSEYYSHILFGDPTLRLIYAPKEFTGPKLKIMDKYGEINLSTGETRANIKIENIGNVGLIATPIIMYLPDSEKVARIDTSYSGGDYIQPNQQISIPFFVETDFGGLGEAIAQVKFITNDSSNPLSESITIKIKRN